MRGLKVLDFWQGNSRICHHAINVTCHRFVFVNILGQWFAEEVALKGFLSTLLPSYGFGKHVASDWSLGKILWMFLFLICGSSSSCRRMAVEHDNSWWKKVFAFVLRFVFVSKGYLHYLLVAGHCQEKNWRRFSKVKAKSSYHLHHS